MSPRVLYSQGNFDPTRKVFLTIFKIFNLFLVQKHVCDRFFTKNKLKIAKIVSKTLLLRSKLPYINSKKPPLQIGLRSPLS
jgi:hypothetical protein